MPFIIECVFNQDIKFFTKLPSKSRVRDLEFKILRITLDMINISILYSMSPTNSSIFTYYGCFNSLPTSGTQEALPLQQTNGSGPNNLLYTLSDCKAASLSNPDVSGSVAFGMQKWQLGKDGKSYGYCYYSDPSIETEAQINSAVLYGSPDASRNMCGMNDGIGDSTGGIGKDLMNAVYVNTSAIDFFTDVSIKQRIRERANIYISSLQALNIRFANVINQIDIASEKSEEIYEASVKAHTNEIIVILKEMLLLKLGIENTCEEINQKIDYVNTEIRSIDNKKILAELKLHRLYGSDNAAAGWLFDSQKLTTIMTIENISLIAVAIIYIILYHSFKKTSPAL